MDGMITRKLNNECTQTLQFAAVTTQPARVVAKLEIQKMIATGFLTKRQSSSVLTVTSTQSSKDSQIKCDAIHKKLQKSYKTSAHELCHFEGSAWHTWVYSCYAVETPGPDCIAVIKV